MNATTRLGLAWFAGLLCALAPAARAGVTLVDAAGGGDHLDIASAIAAAADGDAILVRPAAAPYAGFVLDGKALHIESEVTNVIVPVRPSEVRNIPVDSVVVLRSLAFQPTFAQHVPGLVVANCDGPVRVENCQATGGTGVLLASGGQPGASLEHCADVGLVKCTLWGGDGAASGSNDFDATDGGDGVLVKNSSAWLHGGAQTGGKGGNHDDPDVQAGEHAGVGDGGHGVHVESGCEVLLAGCIAVGGKGGVQIVGLTKSKGGHGFLLAGGSLGHQRGSSFAGGSGTAIDGRKVVATDGELDVVLPPPRALTSKSPVRTDESISLTVNGVPGDAASLLASLDPRGGWMPTLSGPTLVGTLLGGVPIPLGTVPANGSLAVTLALPAFPPDFEHLDLFLQLSCTSASGTTLEAGTTLLVVDSAY